MTQPHTWVATDLEAPWAVRTSQGQVVAYTQRCPVRERANQDAALVLDLGAEGVVLAVVDGAGGQPGAERAAGASLQALTHALHGPEGSIRERVLQGIEAAHRAVVDLRVGAGATIALALVRGDQVRTFHVGDSGLLLVGQRGVRHFASIAHSPVGYAIEAGVLDEEEALSHEDRHLVSNLLGAEGMRIDMSTRMHMGARSTLLLASDGLFDNLAVDDIVEAVRKGPLAHGASLLADSARARMAASDDAAGKPDDLTLLVFRRPTSR